MRKKEHSIISDKHDEKTCFRCRLHKLWDELQDKNEIDFILVALAEASGRILSQLGPDDKKKFMRSIMEFIYEDMKEHNETNKQTKTTKH